ncbi:MAG TPA: hypothetical protein VKK81_27170, partial [Candidatus Binatia bacterium]|nr:hypothetical protein [Candidatus Binatia bacterium]
WPVLVWQRRVVFVSMSGHFLILEAFAVGKSLQCDAWRRLRTVQRALGSVLSVWEGSQCRG